MRSWSVIPVAGIVVGGAGMILGVPAVVALAGAALAAAVRALAPTDDAPGTWVAALASAGLAVVALADHGGATSRQLVALAMAGWAIAELARPSASALVALAPAVVGAVLDPALVGLVMIAGVRLVRAADRPRYALVVPFVGGLALALAVLAGTSWLALGHAWFASAAHPVTPLGLAQLAGDALGPLLAVAALAGLALAIRPRAGELALVAVCASALLVDLRAGTVSTTTLGCVALLAGLAVARLAAMIRIPSGQVMIAATLGALLIAPPAWTTVDRGARTHNAQASR